MISILSFVTVLKISETNICPKFQTVFIAPSYGTLLFQVYLSRRFKQSKREQHTIIPHSLKTHTQFCSIIHRQFNVILNYLTNPVTDVNNTVAIYRFRPRHTNSTQLAFPTFSRAAKQYNYSNRIVARHTPWYLKVIFVNSHRIQSLFTNLMLLSFQAKAH